MQFRQAFQRIKTTRQMLSRFCGPPGGELRRLQRGASSPIVTSLPRAFRAELFRILLVACLNRRASKGRTEGPRRTGRNAPCVVTFHSPFSSLPQQPLCQRSLKRSRPRMHKQVHCRLALPFSPKKYSLLIGLRLHRRAQSM